ncbi:hypothetical protein CcaCcLH18_09600 [Colletotrichum camelliae]|nr:hypothetical protein CcaCcLH18_09600 [Colletotrichum camelliae]
MATEFDASYLCFTQARCRLCQFPVHRGDLIVAAVEEGFATELKLPRSGDVWDRQLRITFHTCFRKKCGRREEPTVCYHVDCYQLRLYSITPTFLTATEYSFTPSPDEERRRSEYIRQILACKLEQMVFGAQSLPYELWLMVARHLVRQCALHMAQSQVRAADKVGDTVLDLTQSVFASYLKINGRYYIKRLQNSPDPSSGSGCCLLLPAQNSREEDVNIFVAEDHIGIRRVVFVSPKQLEERCRSQSSVPSAWWKHISQGVMPSAITIKGDGLKVRSIESSQMQHLALVSWPTPMSSSPVIVNLATLEAPHDPPDGLRMEFFDCNSPDVFGYSVALMGRTIAGVISHKKNEADVQSVYEKAGPTGCYWQFMPMNEGEFLTDICRLATPPSATGHDVTGMTVREMPFLYHQG